jgi:histidinol phosphatase-like PHP family hydrolase
MTGWPRIDMHLHATHYRLQTPQEDMTVSNIARRLEQQAYVAAGIVEHLDTSPKHPFSCLEAMVTEFRTVSSALELFVGAELDYQEDAITIAEAPAIKRRLGLDFYLAAAHGVGDGVTCAADYVQDHHRRLMGIVEQCGYVDIVAHPWGEGHAFARRGLIETWHFEMVPERYLQEFIDAVKYHNKAIEINRKAWADRDDPAFGHYLHMLRNARAAIAIGSDAHSMDKVGSAEPLNAWIERAGFDAASIWTPATNAQ